MSIPKRFYQLQDLILLRTSLEKVKLHVDERKERTVYKWINQELTEFQRKYEKIGCKEQGDELREAIKEERWDLVKKNVDSCLKYLKEEIEKIYREMADSNVNV
ncbi:hypothetical protein [Metallosphaera hakonensis]|uniref:Uncharacterized protein n=1 Tax=Metallosphaera hakonensis JCM 8857 = DSM 7519 TaxID=1293036 RepID=A0A2U9IUJ7_9CREN|nr:hypothetical protein [Metallosphaera hakonensis]AWR99663.1 hypothetical protein DFR87_08150 [Metallosphaera hakonensis JCM 8857 = DSM 7519]